VGVPWTGREERWAERSMQEGSNGEQEAWEKGKAAVRHPRLMHVRLFCCLAVPVDARATQARSQFLPTFPPATPPPRQWDGHLLGRHVMTSTEASAGLLVPPISLPPTSPLPFVLSPRGFLSCAVPLQARQTCCSR